jgi:predicted PurR-regulated permease PerM
MAVLWVRRTKLSFSWMAAVVGIILLGAWLLAEVGDLLLLFLVSLALTFMLNPMVRVLERRMSRTVAVVLIVLAIVGLFAGALLVVVPRVSLEVQDLATNVPTYAEKLRTWGESLIARISKLPVVPKDVDLQQQIQEQLASRLQWLVQHIGVMIKEITIETTAIFARLATLVLIPFITFYLLKDFERIRVKALDLLPRRNVALVSDLFHEAGHVLGGYVRGQLFVSLVVAMLTSVGLLVAGIDYPFILGFMAGLLNLVPYVGLAVSFGVASLVALLGAAPLVSWLKVGVVFAVVQALEGNVISPRVVGRQVGLHPLWVIFALLFFGHFWGFWGLLLAIPTAAVLNVVAQRWYARYRGSAYYRAGEAALAPERS